MSRRMLCVVDALPEELREVPSGPAAGQGALVTFAAAEAPPAWLTPIRELGSIVKPKLQRTLSRREVDEQLEASARIVQRTFRSPSSFDTRITAKGSAKGALYRQTYCNACYPCTATLHTDLYPLQDAVERMYNAEDITVVSHGPGGVGGGGDNSSSSECDEAAAALRRRIMLGDGGSQHEASSFISGGFLEELLKGLRAESRVRTTSFYSVAVGITAVDVAADAASQARCTDLLADETINFPGSLKTSAAAAAADDTTAATGGGPSPASLSASGATERPKSASPTGEAVNTTTAAQPSITQQTSGLFTNAERRRSRGSLRRISVGELCRIAPRLRGSDEYNIHCATWLSISADDQPQRAVAAIRRSHDAAQHLVVTISVTQRCSMLPARSGVFRLFDVADCSAEQPPPGAAMMRSAIAALISSPDETAVAPTSIAHHNALHFRTITSLLGSAALKPQTTVLGLFVGAPSCYFSSMPHIAACRGYCMERLLHMSNSDIERVLLEWVDEKNKLTERVQLLKGEIETMQRKEAELASQLSSKYEQADLLRSASMMPIKRSAQPPETPRSGDALQAIGSIASLAGSFSRGSCSSAVDEDGIMLDEIPDDADAAFYAECGLDRPPATLSLMKQFHAVIDALHDAQREAAKRKEEYDEELRAVQGRVAEERAAATALIAAIHDVKGMIANAQHRVAPEKMKETTTTTRGTSHFAESQRSTTAASTAAAEAQLTPKRPPLDATGMRARAAQFMAAEIRRARGDAEGKGDTKEPPVVRYEVLAGLANNRRMHEHHRQYLHKRIASEEAKAAGLRAQLESMKAPQRHHSTSAPQCSSFDENILALRGAVGLCEYCTQLHNVYCVYQSTAQQCPSLLALLPHFPPPFAALLLSASSSTQQSLLYRALRGATTVLACTSSTVEAEAELDSDMWPEELRAQANKAVDKYRLAPLPCSLLEYPPLRKSCSGCSSRREEDAAPAVAWEDATTQTPTAAPAPPVPSTKSSSSGGGGPASDQRRVVRQLYSEAAALRQSLMRRSLTART